MAETCGIPEISCKDIITADEVALFLKVSVSRLGVEPAKGEIAKGDIIINMDADGSTDPVEIPNFLEPLLKGYDFIKGSRFLRTGPSKMAWFRRFGNWVLFTEINLLFGTRYTDVCSGYNAYWKRAWAKTNLPEEVGTVPELLSEKKNLIPAIQQLLIVSLYHRFCPTTLFKH